MWERQVGERARQLRKERNMTRAEFGKLLGVSERYVGKIERGSPSVTAAVIAKICSKTGVSADYIIFGGIDTVAAAAALNDLTHEQIQIIFEIAMRVIKFLGTDTGNNTLIQEVLRQHKNGSV